MPVPYDLAPTVVRALTRARWMPQLAALGLDSTTVGDAGAEAIGAANGCANLDSLDLARGGLTDRGLVALCRSPHLVKLQTLELEGNAFTADGVREIGSAAFAPVLHYLDLPNCGLDGPALAALAAAPFPALRVLDVSGHTGGDAATRTLVGSPVFRSLEAFWANGCDLGFDAVAAIADAGFVALEDLSLSHNRLDARAVARLVRSKAAARLQVLHLAHNPLGVDGVIELAEAELPALRWLNLQGVRLGREAIAALVRAPWRRRIGRLHLSSDCVGERGQEVLAERFGEDVLTFDEE